MNRRSFLQRSTAAALLPLAPRALRADAAPAIRRVRPSDANWPSPAAWKKLNDAVNGNLIQVNSPLTACVKNPADCAELFANIKNPYYIGDNPGLTQTLGWVDAWTSQPSVYAVAARNANDVAAAVNFARENNLRLVVRGGGHSYQGTSNAQDSLLLWTRHMHDISLADNFVPQNCQSSVKPQRAVTLGSGAYWFQAYDAVTTKAGGYVQGGGCTTVGVAGLIQSGGFGSFSKHFGTAASNLLEAEVVTADGQIRIANACTNSNLFWALKGGGGGTFGAISKLTLRVHDLPELAGGANFKVKASSDEAYRRLIRRFVAFYREALFNEHWGEQAHFSGDNVLGISMVHLGLTTEESRKIWQPFFDWFKQSPADYSLVGDPVIGSMPFRHWWDVDWRKEHHHDVFKFDSRAGAGPNNAWWNGDAGQVAFVIWGFESLWMPESLLQDDSQEKLANAIFAASRFNDVELHFNKGLAGAPAEAIAATKDSATNPSVCTSFALAIVADGQGPAYPGIPNHEPRVAEGRKGAENVHRCMNELRGVASNNGAYVSESNFFETDFQHAYWGVNHARLAEIKKKYDPSGLFFVHNGVGSEEWSADGFTRRT
jgi:FAD/FMN-containing dehydrogenase